MKTEPISEMWLFLYKELERQMKSKETTLNNPSYHHQVTLNIITQS
jgi:hypothetical protein